MISKNGLTYEEYIAESLRTDPEYAAKYVASVLDEGTQQELLVAICRIPDDHKDAYETGLAENRTSPS